MDHRKTTGELWLELLAALAMLGVRFVLFLCRQLLGLAGPSLVATLIILPFIKNPMGGLNGLGLAAYFMVFSGVILAWLLIIVRPFVNDSLPPGRTVGNILAGWVAGVPSAGGAGDVRRAHGDVTDAVAVQQAVGHVGEARPRWGGLPGAGPLKCREEPSSAAPGEG